MVTHRHHRMAIPANLVLACHHHSHHLHFHLHPRGDDDFILNVAGSISIAIVQEALRVGECPNPNPKFEIARVIAPHEAQQPGTILLLALLLLLQTTTNTTTTTGS